MTKTLWISILGLNSGRTGLVLNDGQSPYKDGDRTFTDGEAWIVSRYDGQGLSRIEDTAEKAETINVLSYDRKRHVQISKAELVVALREYDGLAELMPD